MGWSAALPIAALALAAQAAAAPPAIASPAGAWVRFFGSGGLPPELERALEAYAAGRFFETVEAARQLRARPERPSEAHRLAGLALAELGWQDLAARELLAVVEERPASPYAPLALLRWVEGEMSAGRFGADLSWLGDGVPPLRPSPATESAAWAQFLGSRARLELALREAIARALLRKGSAERRERSSGP